MGWKEQRATFGQASQILSVVMDQKPTVEKVDAILELGILTDLMKADLGKVDRSKVKKVLGLPVAEIRSRYYVIVASGSEAWPDFLGRFKLMAFPPWGVKAFTGPEESLISVYHLGGDEAQFHAEIIAFTEDIWTEDAIELLSKQKLRLATLRELLRFKLSNPNKTSWFAGPVGMKGDKEVIAMVQGDELYNTPTNVKIGKEAFFIALPK